MAAWASSNTSNVGFALSDGVAAHGSVPRYGDTAYNMDAGIYCEVCPVLTQSQTVQTLLLCHHNLKI
jgi:hypothetical protein